MALPLVGLIIIVAVGMLVSVAFNRFARSWFPTQIGPVLDRTSPLVGIAGAFIGLHVGIVLGLTPLFAYLPAIVGAFVVMCAWHRWM
jgi:hypothetical protein